MPGGFPFTPSRPASPVYERIRPTAVDGTIINASKRLCLTAAHAATAISTTASSSMISIIRSVRAMQRLPFRIRRAQKAETRRAASPVTFSNGALASTPSESPPGTKLMNSKEAQISSQHTPGPIIAPQLPVKLESPFPLLRPTFVTRLAFPQYAPESPPARALATDLSAAADDSDSSSTFDDKWIPSTLKPQIKTSLSSLSSAVSDLEDWRQDSYKWQKHGDLSRSPTKHSTTKSRAELLEEQQGTSRQTRKSILKAKIAQGDTSKFSIRPLSKEWEAKVNAALDNGHGQLQARDFQKIVPPNGKAGIDAWLNDESINEYLSLITKHANKDIKSKATPRMHAFSTFFYTSLKSGGYQKVARWAKRANIAATALLEVEKIFIPINPNQNHWTLAVIQPQIPRITHYNSLGTGNKAYLDVICEWLKGELGASFNKDDWDLDYTTESPQQMNGSDCGVFTVTTAKQLMLGLNPMTYGAEDIPTQRRRMVAELVNGNLLQFGS